MEEEFAETVFLRTKDHDVIRAWIEENDGYPVAYISGGEEGIELIEIAFTEQVPAGFEPISWEDFFSFFDDAELTFQYCEEVVPGEEEFGYNFVSLKNPPEDGDETFLPEENEMAEENAYQELRDED